VAWGANTDAYGHYVGQCDVPAPNTGFVAVSGGLWHGLGLKADGSIVAWGGNDSGQCNVPAPNVGFMAVSGGQLHSLGLKADGSIRAWGDNSAFQCNLPGANAGFVGIAAGYWHSYGLTAFYGDLNCDGLVNFADIDAFVRALAGAGPYRAAFPRCHWLNADCNADGAVNFGDINAFVNLLQRGG
jgi:hypothetical protein